MNKLKSIRILPTHARNHRPNTEASTTSPTTLFNTTQPLHVGSTTIQTADTDAARTSSNDLNLVPPATDSQVDEPTTVASETPLWDQAVFEFREECKAEYEKLKLSARKDEYDELGLSKDGIEFANSILNTTLPEAFQEEAGHSKHEIIQRLKSWLPALGDAKGLAMTLARLDPNQLAPYIIAGSFFAVEVGSIFRILVCG